MLNKAQSLNIKQKNTSVKKLKTKIENSNSTNEYAPLSYLEKYLPPTLLGILTMLFYYPSINYPFQFDDLANITKKFDIRFFKSFSFSDIFSPRWIGDILNKISFQISRFDPWCYRLSNILIHIFTGITLFFIFLELLSRLEKNQLLKQNTLLISFLTSALFLLHPVQTQTISYVIQARLEGLAAFLVFLSIYFFIKTSYAKNKIQKWSFFSLLILSGGLSCGTKEIVIVSPFLLMLIDWFFISESDWSKFKNRIWIHAIFTILIFGIFLINNKIHWFTSIFGLKYTMNNNRGNILTQNPDDIITPLHYLISEFKVILHYILIFIWPFDLSVEYDWKLSQSFFAPDSFFPFLGLLAILSLVLNAAYKKQYEYLTFGMLWFFVAIAPRSSIIPSAELICDYKTYLASAGWLFSIAVLITYLINFISKQFKISSEKSAIHKIVISSIIAIAFAYLYVAVTIFQNTASSQKPFAVPLFLLPILIFYLAAYINQNKNSEQLYNQKNKLIASLVLICALGYSTIERNKIWENSITFWTDIIHKAPQKARGYNNLGVALSEAGRFDESIEHYKKAISLDSNYSDPWSNISIAYSMKGEIDLSISSLQNAIRILPYYPEAYNNLGLLYLNKKDYVQAERVLNISIQLRPWYGKALFNLSRLYIEKGDVETGWQYAKRAVEGDFDNAMGFGMYGEICVKTGKYNEGIEACKKAIALGDNSPQILFNLANAYFMNKQLDESLTIYNKLICLDPANPGYVYNSAEAYFSKGEYSKALELFSKVKDMPNGMPESHFRIVHCLNFLNKKADAKQYLSMMVIAQAPDWFRDLAKQEMAKMFPEETNINKLKS